MNLRPVSLDDRICCNNRLPTTTINNEVLLTNVERGLLYGLDDIGSAIFAKIATPIRIAELCDQLSAEYRAEPAEVQRDVLNLLEDMAGHGLIEVMRDPETACLPLSGE